MQPVTIKNKELLITLSWVQKLLMALFLLVILMAVSIKMACLLLLPLLVVGYVYNIRSIQLQKPYHLVLNTQNQWHLVHEETQQVLDAKLIASWQTPVFIALSLRSAVGKSGFMLLRSRLGDKKFARILVGLKHE